MMTRSEKDVVISNLKESIEKAKAIFLTNMIGITSNDAVSVRKNVREVDGAIFVTKNSLFRIAAKGTVAEKMLTGLKGTNAVAFAFGDAPGVAKALYGASKELELVELKAGLLGDKELSLSEVIELAKLPSRDEMLGTLLATFNAPISAFARVLNSIKAEIESQGVENAKSLKVVT